MLTLRRYLRFAVAIATALEALLELLRCKRSVGQKPHQLVHLLGSPLQEIRPDLGSANPEAVRIGRVVERVADGLPLRATCVHRSLAVRTMLARRQVAATIHLGVSRHWEDRRLPKQGRAAHAWVSVGATVVCGGGQLERYAEVGRFGIDRLPSPTDG